MSFFSSVKQPFLELPPDGKIVTGTFIDACVSLHPFFDFLGSGFGPGKSRVGGKITMFQEKFSKDPEKLATLQGIVEHEKELGATKQKDSLTDAILMLKRFLEFFEAIFQELLTDEKDFGKCTRNAYERTLKKHHGWMVQKVFSLAIRGVPYRDKLLVTLGNGVSEEEVLKDMKVYLDVLSQNIKTINDFYQQMGEDKTGKV